MFKNFSVSSKIAEINKLTAPRDMPRRIEICRQALALVDQHRQTKMWGDIQNELGYSLMQSQFGNRAQNLELALSHYQKALDARPRESFPREWAQTINNLGSAYILRVEGDRQVSLEQAINCFEQALQVYKKEMFPRDWAGLMHNLGLVYSNRKYGEKSENL